MSPNIKGSIFALLGFAFFSAHDVIVKYLGGNYSTFQIIFFSVLVSFPFVFWYIYASEITITCCQNIPGGLHCAQ